MLVAKYIEIGELVAVGEVDQAELLRGTHPLAHKGLGRYLSRSYAHFICHDRDGNGEKANQKKDVPFHLSSFCISFRCIHYFARF